MNNSEFIGDLPQCSICKDIFDKYKLKYKEDSNWWERFKEKLLNINPNLDKK